MPPSPTRARRTLVASVLVAGALVAGGLAQAAPADYVGVAACGACHPAAAKAWQASVHARASSPDVLGRHSRDAACLTCHATGEGARALAGVQCEACHGAGVAYAAAADVMRDAPLARALGLRDLRKNPAAVCARCHLGDGGTRAAPLDYATAWKKIAH